MIYQLTSRLSNKTDTCQVDCENNSRNEHKKSFKMTLKSCRQASSQCKMKYKFYGC